MLSRSPARLEYARALAAHGERPRSAGTSGESRSVLLEALELSHVCGAAALEQRVLASLRAIGARPRRPWLTGPDALTPRERRIAEMAAGGMTNREIAEALFVTVRTVEFHLAGAYRKLGVAGRRECRRACGADRIGRSRIAAALSAAPGL